MKRHFNPEFGEIGVGPTPAVDLKVPTSLWINRLQLKPEALWITFLQNLAVGQSVCIGQVKGVDSCPRCFGGAEAGIEREEESYRFYAHWNLVTDDSNHPFTARVEGRFELHGNHLEFMTGADLVREPLFAAVCARLALINAERAGMHTHKISGRGARLYKLALRRQAPAQIIHIAQL